MRALLLAALVLLPAAAAQEARDPPAHVGATISADFEGQYQVVGRLEDADGRPLGRYPMTVGVEGPDGPVVHAVQLLTSCWGDFDPFWDLRNLSERMTAKVTVDGASFTQPVDPLHRRNDFPLRLDRSVPEPNAECADEAALAANRLTVTGQALRASAPYQGRFGQTLYAVPVGGVPVHVRFLSDDGRAFQETVYANGDGVYKYSFTFDRAPVGNVSVRFEDDPTRAYNATVDASTVKYVVLSRPAVDLAGPADVPAVGLLAALLAAAAVALVARRRGA